MTQTAMGAFNPGSGTDRAGTTAQRPTNADIGDEYFDTSINKMLVWNGTQWNGAGASKNIRTVTANTVLTSADAGKWIMVNSNASLVMTLPDSTANPYMEVGFQTMLAAASGAGVSLALTTNTDLVAGGLIAVPAANHGIKNTQATCKIGDCISVWSDGAGTWWVDRYVGTWAQT